MKQVTTHIPNNKYENFVNQLLEAAVECISTKPRAKSTVSWESKAFRKKRDDMKRASLLKKDSRKH